MPRKALSSSFALVALLASGALRAAACIALVLFLAQAIGLDVRSWASVLVGFVAAAAMLALSKAVAAEGLRRIDPRPKEIEALQATANELRVQVDAFEKRRAFERAFDEKSRRQAQHELRAERRTGDRRDDPSATGKAD